MQRPLVPPGIEGDGHGARLVGAFLRGVAARLQQMHRTMTPAGVIIPAPAGGTSGSHTRVCLSKPEWVL